VSRVSVVVPNYNGERLLPACLDALARQTQSADEIVVVDDASTDGSCALIRRRYPQVRLLPLPANSGFCHAANAGLRAAQGDIRRPDSAPARCFFMTGGTWSTPPAYSYEWTA
jgi:glycosyltransferase involved in cell wall biosynthesis